MEACIQNLRDDDRIQEELVYRRLISARASTAIVQGPRMQTTPGFERHGYSICHDVRWRLLLSAHLLNALNPRPTLKSNPKWTGCARACTVELVVQSRCVSNLYYHSKSLSGIVSRAGSLCR